MKDLTPEERRQIYEEEKARIEGPSGNKKKSSAISRSSVITSSSFSIAICLILIVGLNFFSQYIALYVPYVSGDSSYWTREPFLTPDYSSWLPIATIGLVLIVIGQVLILILKKYLWQELILMISNLIGIAVILSLLNIYPFDYSSIRDPSWAQALPLLINIFLGIIVFGLIVAVLVRGIKLIITVTTKIYNE
jgi:hypothetical protein